MEQADDTPITYRAATEETTQAATQATQATEEEGILVTRHAKKARDAIVLDLAQNAILAGLIIITAGVPTW